MPNLCIVPARVLEDRELTERDLRTLLAIGTFTDRNGQGVFASKKTLAKLAGIDDRHLRRSVRTLVERGYVVQEHRKGADGLDTTALISIVLGEGQISPPRGAESARGRGAKSALTRGAESASQTTQYNDPTKRTTDITPSAPPAVPKPYAGLLAEIRAAYPRRGGGQGWSDAERAIVKAVEAGVDPDELLRGARHYADLMRRQGSEGTPYVKQASTFFGRGQHWREFQDPVLVASPEDDYIAGLVAEASLASYVNTRGAA